MWYHKRMLKFKEALFLSLDSFGCSPANTNPGATFLVGLNGYQGEMESSKAARNVSSTGGELGIL